MTLRVAPLQAPRPSDFEIQRSAELTLRIRGELLPELSLPFGVLPGGAIKSIVVAAALRGQPNLMQRFLQIHNQLAAVGESQRHHAADTLVVNVYV